MAYEHPSVYIATYSNVCFNFNHKKNFPKISHNFTFPQLLFVAREVVENLIAPARSARMPIANDNCES